MSTAQPFFIKKALLIANRTGLGNKPAAHDISKAMVDIEIFEHLSLPYTSALISFSDTADTLSSLDIQGAEYVELTIANHTEALTITKNYYITKVENVVRGTENADLIVLNCIDEIAFRSHLFNVNIVLDGTPLQMIGRIAQDYLNTNILHNEEKYSQYHKYIVPNLTPLETMKWISQQSITTIGMPHFLFGIWADENLRYVDLEDLLTADTINKNRPFVYGMALASMGTGGDTGIQTQRIINYNYNNNHNIFDLIDQGYISGNHFYYDTMANREYLVDWRVSRDMFNPMIDQSLFKSGHQRYPYAPATTFDGAYMEEYQSRRTFRIATNRPWDEGYTVPGSRPSLAGYTNDIANEAMREFMDKETMTWQIDGKRIGQLSPGSHFIGKKVRCLFGRTMVEDTENASGKIDAKKSGDYIVMAVKHRLSKERYDIFLTGTKLGSPNSADMR